jgi:hypothetical protein
VMKRIATPMIGGIVTSAIMELLIYPVIYVLWKKRGLKEQDEDETPLLPPVLVPPVGIRRRLPRIIATVAIAAALIYGGSKAWQNWSTHSGTGAVAQNEPLAVQTVGDLTVKVFGDLRSTQSNLLLEFRDAAGELVDVGAVRFALNMDMAGMTMHDAGKLRPGGEPGQYRVQTSPTMAGDWRANLSYDGPRGHGETNILLSVKPSK